ncbi:hypothetical protein IFM89_005763 [Coptis chinensis]|uniref:phosphopyruvate hydratase n=1 Tax=Coptis chinensis TaxID=261450 RepID=A0A835M9X9_9MAGN|nr:hypothetical protein IFM89_005763 [Coptis chinensis]
MPSPEDLFSTLNRHIHRSYFEQAVKVSDQVLGIIPGDVDALRCKIVGLIKVDDYDKALSTIQNLPSTLNAFNFYKEQTSATMLLETQVLYRLGRMDAYEIHGGKNIVAYFSKEFMILPVGASSFKEAMKMGVEVYHNLKRPLNLVVVYSHQQEVEAVGHVTSAVNWLHHNKYDGIRLKHLKVMVRVYLPEVLDRAGVGQSLLFQHLDLLALRLRGVQHCRTCSKSFMAFGGMRLCAGAEFTKLQMSVVLHSLQPSTALVLSKEKWDVRRRFFQRDVMVNEAFQFGQATWDLSRKRIVRQIQVK